MPKISAKRVKSPSPKRMGESDLDRLNVDQTTETVDLGPPNPPEMEDSTLNPLFESPDQSPEVEMPILDDPDQEEETQGDEDEDDDRGNGDEEEDQVGALAEGEGESDTSADEIPVRHRRQRPLPKPPTFRLQSEKFFKYWNQMYRRFGDRVTVYLYRLWPVIDRARSGLDYKNIDVLLVPLKDEDELQYKYGAGDYHFKLTDAAFRKQVAQCTLKGLREVDEHPPVVDPVELVMEDPANAPYIAWARSRGILRDTEGEDMKDDAIKQLTGTIERMNDKMMAQKDQQKPPTPADAVSSAQLKGVEIISEAAKLGTKMLQEASDNARTQQDPTAQIKVFKELVDTVRSLSPTPEPPAPAADAKPSEASTDAMFKLLGMFMTRESDLQKSLFTAMTERISYAEKLAEKSANPPPTQAPAAAAQTRDPLSDLERLASLKDKLQDLFGSNDEGGGRRSSGSWIEQLPAILQGLAMVGGAVGSALHNYAVVKTGQGQPVQPQAIPSIQAQATDVLPAPSAPGEMEPVNPMANLNPYHKFLEKIHRPLIVYLSDEGRTGADFADWMIDGYGRMAYDQVVEPGKELLVTLIQSYPPIWQEVSKIPQRFDAFLDEFFNRDSIREEEDRKEEERERRVVRRVKVSPKPEPEAPAAPTQ